MAPILPGNNDIWEEVSDDEVSSGDVEPPPIILNNDSDASSNSDDEVPLHSGYELLPQEPEIEENQRIEESEDEPLPNTEMGDSERVVDSTIHSIFSQTLNTPPPAEWVPPENVFVLDEKRDVNPMDTEHIEKIKSAMAGFTLPTSAVPDWAVLIPEEEWKLELVSRLKHKKGVSSGSFHGTVSGRENNLKLESSQQESVSVQSSNLNQAHTSDPEKTMQTYQSHSESDSI